MNRSPWNEFVDSLDWRQGEHITICGQIGNGKTTLARALMPLRRYNVFIATKPYDPVISELRKDGFVVVRNWPVPPEVYNRVVFWPKIDTPADVVTQKEAIRRFLIDVYTSGGWTVCVDEYKYVCHFLGLAPLVDLLILQGRTLGISMIGGTQRPRYLPLSLYDQPTHLFLSRDNDLENVRRLSEFNAANVKMLRELLPNLEKFDFLYLNTRTGDIAITRAEVG